MPGGPWGGPLGGPKEPNWALICAWWYYMAAVVAATVTLKTFNDLLTVPHELAIRMSFPYCVFLIE